MRQFLALFFVLLISSVASAAENDLRLWYTSPARQWEDAVPIGNGRMGAMVFGGVVDERIQFNEDTLWTGKPHDYVRAGAGDALQQIRDLVFAGNDKDAATLAKAKFLSDPVRQMAYQPFGDLHFHFPDHDAATDYHRELDLTTAIAKTTYRVGDTQYTRETFASFPDQVIVTHITSSKPGGLTFTLKMDSPHKGSQNKRIAPDTLALIGKVQDDGLSFESRLRVITDGGTATITDGQISVSNANSATLLLAAATSFKNFQDITANPAERCAAILSKLEHKTYDAILKDHLADYSELFNRVNLNLGRTSPTPPTDERLHRRRQSQHVTKSSDPKSSDGLAADPALAALYFQMGRYMLIASSRPGSQPANLQGNWNELLSPPWESKWTTNINLEMNYWPAEETNLSECTAPLVDLVNDLVISGSRTAKEQYHAGGWVLHHNTDLWRGTAPINNIDGIWPTGGAWLCYHLWEHYLFTGDKTFLSERAYIPLREASQFFVDTLVKDPKTGWLVTNPSFSPEQGGLCAGPSMDMQIIRALFDATLESGHLLGRDKILMNQIAATRAAMAPDQIGQHGQLQEWVEDVDVPNNNHRHMSPLWGMYPGAEFTPENPKLFAAAKLLLKWRGDGSTGWSYAWRINLDARAYDGDQAYRQLAMQLGKRTFSNLFDKCGPFQVDGDFGACAGVAEMLLQSQIRDSKTGTHEISLLPALPSAWPKGSVTGLCARGGFEVDMTWDKGRLTHTVIRSKLGNPCVLEYNGSKINLKTTAGATYTYEGTTPWAVLPRSGGG